MKSKTKKIIKTIAWSFLGLLVLLTVAIAASPLWLGSAAGAIARSVVPAQTGTEFEVGKISANVFSGKFSVEGIRLGNPKGYKPANAVTVGSVFVNLDMASLLSDVIVVKEIAVKDTFVSYVSNNGTNNFEWISNYMAANSKQKRKEKKEKDEKTTADKKAVIDRLAVSGTVVQFEFIPFPIPDITLNDVGKKSNGATLSEIGDQIWKNTSKSFKSTGTALGGVLNSLTSEIDETAGFIDTTVKSIRNETKKSGDKKEKGAGLFKKVEGSLGK